MTDIARELKISRNTTAKYLEILRISGHVDMDSIGTAKVYYLSHRIPVSTLLNFSSEYILVVNSYLQIIQVNRQFLDLLKMEKNDVVGEKADRILNSVSRDREIISKLHEAIMGKEQKEKLHFCRDDRECYFRARIIPSTFDNGEHGATLILEDVTEETCDHNSLLEHRDKLEKLVRARTKELEEANSALKKEIAEKEKAQKLLKEREERYRRLYMESPLGYQVMSMDGILLDVSSEWLHTMGYTVEEVIGQAFENFLPENNKEMHIKPIDLRNSDDTFHSYCEMVKKDGSTIVASFSCNLGHASEENKEQVQCIMRDVTQHRKLGESIQKNEKRLKAILNSLHNGIVVVDPESYEIVYVNDAGCSILGDSEKNILGKKCSDLICCSPGEKCPAASENSGILTSSCILAKSDGRNVPVIRTVTEAEIDGKKQYIENLILDER
ncbi:PAS domain S-box protein [Methanolobus zinderi]|uniref:PAS domain S-box protein n=1 Tax=Methanolobus zinderi TaxID=536044 RepID=A0A7D5I4A7_9EURY|nr:PAS domain S-box protein [Methanolobus zinderi]QLC49463.1 PAS domain S-box protein [Methanolobus zinderi]